MTCAPVEGGLTSRAEVYVKVPKAKTHHPPTSPAEPPGWHPGGTRSGSGPAQSEHQKPVWWFTCPSDVGTCCKPSRCRDAQ